MADHPTRFVRSASASAPPPSYAESSVVWDGRVDVREVMDGWVDGWAWSRETARPRAVDGGWFLESSAPEENGRVVLTQPTHERLSAIADSDPPERRLVKFAGDPDVWLPRFPGTWVPEPAGWFMTRALEPTTVDDLPDGYALEVEATATRVEVRIMKDGEPAARGQLGLGAEYAVPDRIVTGRGHQRLGLGSRVMAELGQLALDAGRSQAVLGATVEGRALYERLGWQVVAPMTGAYCRRSA